MKKAILTLALAAVASSSMSGFVYGPVMASTKAMAPITVCQEASQKAVTADELQAEAEQFLYEYNYRGLINYCDEVIASNPNLPDAYFYRAIGRYNFNYDDADLATADLYMALELDPQHTDSLIWLGIIATDYGDYEDAIFSFSAVLEIDPVNLVALDFRTELHDLLGDLDGLEADFTQYISIAATESYGYLNRGLVRAEKGDIANAISDLEKTSELLVAEGADSKLRDVQMYIAKLKSGQSIG